MGLAEKYLPHYTYDDWVRWEDPWELIEGHPIAMIPMPVPEHQRVAGELLSEFNLAVRKSNCKECRVYLPIDYKISEDTILAPDLLIVCGKIEKKYLDFAPSLVVEILSPSSALRDRDVKYKLYEREGVKYYLIVDIQKRSIEVYQLIDGEYKEQESEGQFTFDLHDNCSITPQLKDIWE